MEPPPDTADAISDPGGEGVLPAPRPRRSAESLIEAWRGLPGLDAAALRRDLDDRIDQSLLGDDDAPFADLEGP